MPTQIGSQYYVDLALNNQEIAVSPSLLPKVFELNNNHHHVPSILMYLNDPTGLLLNKLNLGDGVPIDIASTSDPNAYPPTTTTYRMLGRPKAVSAGMTMMAITGYLDATQYLRQVVKKSYRGNSSDVIQQLASDSGMTAIADATNDTMAWLPNLKTFSQFARHLTDYGWASPTSMMSMAVNRSKQLIFKNISEHIKTAPLATFYYGASPPAGSTAESYSIAQYKVTNRSGLLNHWMGYGANTNQVTRDGTLSTFNKVTSTLLSNTIDVNPILQGQVGNIVRTVFHPPDTGNGHTNFISALHQNKRLRSMFSTDLEILIIGDCKRDIFDLVNVDIIDSSTYESNPAYQGQYLITAKTRVAWNNMYYTKLQLCTQGGETSGLVPEET
jgi:hypothetical protein